MTRRAILWAATGAAGLVLTAVGVHAAAASTASDLAPAAVPGSSCSRTAAAPLPAAAAGDNRFVEMWRHNPASQVPPADAAPLDASQAVAAAKVEGARGQAVAGLDDAKGAAVEVPYARAAASLGSNVSEGIVAADRCVWLVTVNAPFTARSAPYGVRPPTFDSYTMVFDSATGQYLETAAGPTAPDVMTGRNVAAP